MPLTSRLYETDRDLPDMLDMLMEARARTDDWRYAHVSECTFRFFMVLCHLNPYEHIRLWRDRGKLAAYAILGEDPSFDYQVAPEYAWSGIEVEALDWAEARLSELRKRDAKQWSGVFVSGARQDDAKRIAFLEQRGFRYSGEFAEVNMLRSLEEPIPAPVFPAGYQVRSLADDPGELSSRAAAYREVWLPWSDGNVSDEDYVRFTRLPGYDRDLDIVAVAPDGTVAALANGWIDPVNRIGEFDSVSTRPAYRRTGLMKAILLEGLRRLKERGMNRACVSTGVTTTPALRLYESVGFKVVNKYFDYVK